ncbi:hypothetical protein A2U01_0005716, partial [Trifolium medium]|nr:hypothetical protein [Trifolium medium]
MSRGREYQSLTWGKMVSRCSPPDQMAQQGIEILRMLSDQNKKMEKKKSKKGAGSTFSSAAGGISSESPVVGSPQVVTSKLEKKKRKMDVDFVDLEVNEPGIQGRTVVPGCWSKKGFLSLNPLVVEEQEKAVIRSIEPKRREKFLVDDIAGLMRLVSTALVLNEDSAEPSREAQALKEKISEQEAMITKLEIAAEDFEEKKK